MKKVICLLLVILLCMYLPCGVFAANSPGNDGEAPTTPPADNPVTGDSFPMNFWLVVMLIALLAMVVLFLCYRKFMKR